MTQHIDSAVPGKISLPVDGFSRWKEISKFVPFSREKFRQLVRAGKAPQPIFFSERCTAYPNRELHRFFADPLNYCAEVKTLVASINAFAGEAAS